MPQHFTKILIPGIDDANYVNVVVDGINKNR